MIAEAVFIATAYSWGCGAGSLTRLEAPPRPFFTVAVDPTIIPLGMAVEIDAPFLTTPGRMWRAEDTGPDIVGNRIDIMVDTCEHAEWWGRREVKVRIRKDLGWQDRLSTQHATLADRLVSIRGLRNLRERQSSVSRAEALAVKRSAMFLSSVVSTGTGSRASGTHADHSSLLAWARLATQ